MIPAFNENGLLPPGIHVATFEEFKERFAIFQGSDQRLRIFENFERLVKEARKTGFVKRLIGGGSFVSATPAPNDFDCILVLDPACKDAILRPFEYIVVSKRMVRRLYHADAIITFEGTEPVNKALAFFQSTRDLQTTGIVEVLL